MKSRERVYNAIEFKPVDRPPFAHTVVPAAQLVYGAALQALLEKFDDDFGWNRLAPLPEKKWPVCYRQGTHKDAFGTVWLVDQSGWLGRAIDFPLLKWENYRNFKWPEPEKSQLPGRFYTAALNGPDDRYFARSSWISFFEILKNLRGPQNLMTDLLEQPPELFDLIEDLKNYCLRLIDFWLAKEVDAIVLADDWAGASALLVDPELWRKIFKPIYRQLIAPVKKANRKVFFHSHGNIKAIVGDLVDMGIDVLHCQVEAMDENWLAREFKGKVCFMIEVDPRIVQVSSAPQQVVEYVRRLHRLFSFSGRGFMATLEILPGFPLKNIQAFYQALSDL